MSRKKMISDLRTLEMNALKELRRIAYNIDSPDLGVMYDAVGKLALNTRNRALLPKATELFSATDQNVKQAAFTVAGKNAFGDYIALLISEMKTLNPVEREQVLQGIQEMFSQTGGPESTGEQKLWIESLVSLGKEHQPTVFSLMRFLGEPGRRWVTGQIRDNITNISLGAIPAISEFPGRTRKKLARLLADIASKRRREMLPYICGIVDDKTYGYLAAFLKGSSWQERAEIAAAISNVGIQSTTGIIMELVGDSNWQVKQALLENINIPHSKFTAVSKVLSYLVKETHTRVRGQAGRTLLLLGSAKCLDSNLSEQRKKIEKQHRTQLLKAAQANKDLDAEWLGVVGEKEDPMQDILKKVSTDDISLDSDTSERPEPVGVSLSDLASPSDSGDESVQEVKDKSVLLSALLGAQRKSIEEIDKPQEVEPNDFHLDPAIPPTSKFLLLLQRMSENVGRDVPIDDMLSKAQDAGMTEEEFEGAMEELEKQGLIYRSSKGTVSYVDMEL